MAFDLAECAAFNHGEIFFTSDTHFCHNKEFLYSGRGFSSIEEHDEELVKRWNEVVGNNDIVIHLGDICLNDNEKAMTYIQRLNGTIYWLRGNHDTDVRVHTLCKNCENIRMFDDNAYAQLCKYHKLLLYCSHYPTYTGNMDDKPFSQHVTNLHGHTHSLTPWFDSNYPFMYNVGVDAHNLTPISIDHIRMDLQANWASLSQQ